MCLINRLCCALVPALAVAAPDAFSAWWNGATPSKLRALSSIDFNDVGVPTGQAVNEARMSNQVRVSGEVVFNGSAELRENFHVVVEVGEAWRTEHPYEGDTFGLLRTSSSEPVCLYNQASGQKNESTGHYSNAPDFMSMIHQAGKTSMIVHIEDLPGGTYHLELHQNAVTGALTLRRSTFMDWSAYHGLWNPCAGTLSPWNTHLGAEEYGPEAKAFAAIEKFPTTDWPWDPQRQWVNAMRYHNVYPEGGNFTAYRAQMNAMVHPYFYGYIFEAGVNSDGSTFGVKRMAMGRKSGELAFVMPDRKTAYMTDDGTNTFISVFVADTEDDLSAGRLLCARVSQTSSNEGGQFDIEWRDMGHAKEEDVYNAVYQMTPRITFHDLFFEAGVVNGSYQAVCPGGFKATHGSEGLECLRVRPGREALASRLESRRYASYLGCTTEWTKMEGFAYSADTGKAYIAMSEVTGGMEDRAKDGNPTEKYDAGTGNHVRLSANRCGCVYEMFFDEHTYFATRMRSLICGVPNGTSCSDNGIANPDNLAAIHGHRALLIGEDSWMRPNNILWKYDLDTGALQERVASTPLQAEVSSPYFYPDIGGFSYINLIAQHPNAPNFQGASLGYVAWPRNCNTTYPDWSMPGDGAADRCNAGNPGQRHVEAPDGRSQGHDATNHARAFTGHCWMVMLIAVASAMLKST
jgi:hypothetical protein